jgi:hypothetical protein
MAMTVARLPADSRPRLSSGGVRRLLVRRVAMAKACDASCETAPLPGLGAQGLGAWGGAVGGVGQDNSHAGTIGVRFIC